MPPEISVEKVPPLGLKLLAKYRISVFTIIFVEEQPNNFISYK